MVKLNLEVCAEMENIAVLNSMEANSSDIFFCKLRCNQCGCTSKEVAVDFESEMLIPGNKKKKLRPKLVNFAHKCDGCEEIGIIKLEPPTHPFRLTAAHSQADVYVPLMGFDCEIVEPFDFSFRGLKWGIMAVDNFIETDIMFEDGNDGWIGYSVVGNMLLSVTDVRYRLERP